MLARLGRAVELLLEDGTVYSELSVERIAALADVSRSSFYRHVADKGALLQWLARDVDRDASDAALAIWMLPGSASRDEVSDAVAKFVGICWDHRLLRKAAYGATTYDQIIRLEHDAAVAGATSLLTQHITAGQVEGWARADIDPEHTAAWLVYMTERGLLTLVGPADRAQLPGIGESLTEILWSTLYAGARDPAGETSTTSST